MINYSSTQIDFGGKPLHLVNLAKGQLFDDSDDLEARVARRERCWDELSSSLDIAPYSSWGDALETGMALIGNVIDTAIHQKSEVKQRINLLGDLQEGQEVYVLIAGAGQTEGNFRGLAGKLRAAGKTVYVHGYDFENETLTQSGDGLMSELKKINGAEAKVAGILGHSTGADILLHLSTKNESYANLISKWDTQVLAVAPNNGAYLTKGNIWQKMLRATKQIHDFDDLKTEAGAFRNNEMYGTVQENIADQTLVVICTGDRLFLPGAGLHERTLIVPGEGHIKEVNGEFMHDLYMDIFDNPQTYRV